MGTETEPVITPDLINVEAVIASKNPALLKIIPRFVIAYLKRIVHQEEVNGYIWRNRDKTGLPFVEAILKEFGVEVEVVDARKGQPPALPELIPSSGRYIVVANHPLGGLDGMALMHALGKVRQDLVFPVNDLLLFVPGLRPLFIPINKHGRNTENARIIDETFASDKMILYFPAGLCSRKQRVTRHAGDIPAFLRKDKEGERIVCDLEWKSTFIKKAKKYRRDILPVFIDGRNSNWFYNLSNFRKRLGIKANLEMLYLVDEMSKQLGKIITMRIGEPIPHTVYDKSRTELQWAEWTKEQVYQLQNVNH